MVIFQISGVHDSNCCQRISNTPHKFLGQMKVCFSFGYPTATTWAVSVFVISRIFTFSTTPNTHIDIIMWRRNELNVVCAFFLVLVASCLQHTFLITRMCQNVSVFPRCGCGMCTLCYIFLWRSSMVVTSSLPSTLNLEFPSVCMQCRCLSVLSVYVSFVCVRLQSEEIRKFNSRW